jgi:N-acetylglucosaminyldiphosphoundecaprenol N-acetyl-beta-D-mannosaminyltransferase
LGGDDLVGPHFRVGGIRVDALNIDKTIEAFGETVDRGSGGYVVFCTASTIVNSRDMPALRTALRDALLIAPDGMPLVWLGRRKVGPEIGRVYGPDFMRALFSATGDRFTHYFYGGMPNVTERMVDLVTRDYPGLRVAGWSTPQLDVDPTQVDAQAMEEINSSRADIVWVGLGHPKQEIWMHTHQGHISAPVMGGVGAAFDFLSETKKEAPPWMKRSGLQWLHRVLDEPGRLWKRYLVGNARFLGIVVADAVRKDRS